MRALIVAEGETFRSVLRDALRGAGFQVVEAGVAEAMETLRDLGVVELGLIDWSAGGVDLVRRIRAEHDYDAMRLMMVTPEFQEALKAGVDAYLLKPFTARTLSDKLIALGLRVKGSR